MEQLYKVSSNPHVRDKVTTHSIMLDVILALCPATLVGFVVFGLPAVITTVLSIATCVIAEYAWQHFMGKPVTIGDFSALLTGLLLALNLPAGCSWYIPVLGGLFAIIVVKQVFGGLGQNFMNPALGARCFLLLSFTGKMTTFLAPASMRTPDAMTMATPLGVLKEGGYEALTQAFTVKQMFIGTIPGTIGEVSAIALIAGGAYLVWKKVISIRIPAAYIITFAVCIILFGGHGLDVNFLAMHLFGGGLMLGSIFMATDYVTSPITDNGKIVFGCIAGLLTAIFRLFGSGAEGVSYAIIISNLLVPLIEKYTMPTAFGMAKKGGK